MLYPAPGSYGSRPTVVVTGAGIITALGCGWTENAAGFREGRTGFGPVTRFDTSKQRVHTAAEARLPAVVPTGRLSPHHARRLDHSLRLLLTAADQAWKQAGWNGAENLPIVLGTTAGGMPLGEIYYRQAVSTPSKRGFQPTRGLYYQSQIQARALADALGCQASLTIISNACAAGTSAIGHAFELIRTGRAERVLAGGYEGLSQMLFAGFDSLQALSTTTCRPFDAGRDGLALGEGAAMLTLETLDSARRRNAAIIGEIAGYGSTIDLHHLTQPHPQGDAAYTSMRLACQSAGLAPDDIDYLNAHGTGTPLNDSSEANGITRWAGAAAAKLPVSSTKASIGHLLGAAGAVEAVICLMALREGFLPPELSFETPDPACTFPIVREPREARLRTALSNSFGFGGVNASLILRRWE